MDIERKLITKEALGQLVGKLLSDGKTILAPVRKENIVMFEPIRDLGEMATDYIATTQSAKSAAFPKVDRILKYENTKQGPKFEGQNTGVFPETVVLGQRPCDAAGFDSLTAIFNWDYKDSLYNDRLARTTFIGISCARCDDYCFCTSVKGSPGSTHGSDILLTETTAGTYLADIITEKGKALVAANPAAFQADSGIEKEKFLADVPVKFNLDDVVAKSTANFEHELWLEQSLRCIGCGACAYVCPTCACFDIQDETSGEKGQRVKLWDSCGFGLFTLHTSGHNPREVQSQRWRQRIMHKFSYMPDRLTVVGCVGCGRCSRACPVDMNLSEHLVNIAEA